MNKEKLVQVVALTKPLLKDSDKILTAENFIAYVARVSNPSNQTNTQTAPKLLKYLKDNAHWSPFEMVHCVMEINTTRDIARQILRHRSYSFQEFSQRYADVNSLGDLFIEAREARWQDESNRQNSLEFDKKKVFDSLIQSEWYDRQQTIKEMVRESYEWALKKGIAKEQARVILPEGLTKSRLYMSGSLRSWIHYCDLRRKNGTQKEHMEIAEQCWQELLTQFPSLEETQ